MQKFKKRIKNILNGFGLYFKLEINSFLILMISLVAIALHIYLKSSELEILVLVVSAFLLFSTEILNTAVEQSIDLISPKLNPKARIVKDLAGAAVFCMTLNFVVVNLVIFF